MKAVSGSQAPYGVSAVKRDRRWTRIPVRVDSDSDGD